MDNISENVTESGLIVDPRNIIPVTGASILNVDRDPDRTSEHYSQTDDISVVKTLNDAGWFVNNYKQVNAHKKEKAKFRTYLATYTHESGLEIPGEGKLTVLQKGSHDGSKKLVLNLGFFRAICANGMVAGSSLFEPLEIKHVGDKPAQLDTLVARLLNIAPGLFDKIREFQGTTLTDAQAIAFADEALKLRFGTEEPVPVSAKEVLVPLRYEDNGNSVWKVLNRVQERLIKKTDLVGRYQKVEVDAAGNTVLNNGKPNLISFNRAVSGVKNIDLNLKINTGLWDLAETFVNTVH